METFWYWFTPPPQVVLVMAVISLFLSISAFVQPGYSMVATGVRLDLQTSPFSRARAHRFNGYICR